MIRVLETLPLDNLVEHLNPRGHQEVDLALVPMGQLYYLIKYVHIDIIYIRVYVEDVQKFTMGENNCIVKRFSPFDLFTRANKKKKCRSKSIKKIFTYTHTITHSHTYYM